MTRAQLIKQVHIVAFQRLGLDREQYEDVVEAAAGVRSVKDLPAEEIETVLVALQRFRVGQVGRPPTRSARSDRHLDSPQQRKIARLMDYLGWTWKSTAKLCKNVTGKDDTRDCDAAELRKVILALIAIIEQDLAAGKLTLSPSRLAEFRFYNSIHHHAHLYHQEAI